MDGGAVVPVEECGLMKLVTGDNPNGDKYVSSVMLVQLLNRMRDEHEPAILHEDFVANVPLVLEGDTTQFESRTHVGYGLWKQCYLLPRREAALMMLAYRYDLQRKLFDYAVAQEARARRAEQFKQGLLGLPHRDKLEEKDRGRTIAEVAELLGIKGSRFGLWLRKRGLIRSDQLPQEMYVARGFFVVVDDGYARTVRVTRTGVEFLNQKWLADPETLRQRTRGK